MENQTKPRLVGSIYIDAAYLLLAISLFLGNLSRVKFLEDSFFHTPVMPQIELIGMSLVIILGAIGWSQTTPEQRIATRWVRLTSIGILLLTLGVAYYNAQLYW